MGETALELVNAHDQQRASALVAALTRSAPLAEDAEWSDPLTLTEALAVRLAARALRAGDVAGALALCEGR